MKFRKKPVVIDAIQVKDLSKIENVQEVGMFMLDVHNMVFDIPYSVDIPTLEGVMKAHVGDWIIKGVKGEFYPVKPDIFEATYEKV